MSLSPFILPESQWLFYISTKLRTLLYSINGKEFIDNKGLTVADVCKYCNGTLLSPLDSYGKNLIKDQFFQKVPFREINNSFSKTIDYYKLSRWLLKIVFNTRRAEKLDCSWFDDARGYILYGLLVENISFSIFAGIHINTTPLPEEAYTYLPMQINEEPKLYRDSLGIVTYGLDPDSNSIRVPMAAHTYCIRFGTAVFYCILWLKTADSSVKMTYDKMFEEEFNFTKVISIKTNYQLKCVSAHSNTTLGYGHLLSASGQAQDVQMIESELGGRSPGDLQEQVSSLMPPDWLEKGRALAETTQFPHNGRIAKKYRKLFGHD